MKKIKAFVYVEVQISVPFTEFPWKDNNPEIRQAPGFVCKTWLSGTDNNSIGGFYGFDSIENAKLYATEYMPKKCRELNIGLTTRVFDAEIVEKASLEMDSPFFANCTSATCSKI
jgi:hypothetical protein